MRDLLIAWRSILRHARRTLVTVSALVVGLAGMVVFQGFLGQMMLGFRDGTILSGIGHLQVAAQARYFVDGEFNPFAYGLPDSAAPGGSAREAAGCTRRFPVNGIRGRCGPWRSIRHAPCEGLPTGADVLCPALGEGDGSTGPVQPRDPGGRIRGRARRSRQAGHRRDGRTGSRGKGG